MLTTVAVKLPCPMRESQCRVSSFWSSGSALVAITMMPAETSASAPTVAGRRRSVGASAKQRNGRSGIRNRGPGDQPPIAKRRGVACGVPEELDDGERRDPAGLRPKPAPPERRCRRRRRQGQAYDEEAALAQQHLDEHAKARQPLAEEAGLLPAARGALPRLAGIREVKRVAERPYVERPEREQADESACGECGRRRSAARPRRRRAQADGRDRKRKIDGDGKPGSRARAGDAEGPRSRRTGAKGEERSAAAGTCAKRSVKNGSTSVPSPGWLQRLFRAPARSARRPPDKQEQSDSRQHDRPEADLPDRAERHARHRVGIAQSGVRIRRHGAERAEQRDRRRGPQLERGPLAA